MKHDSEWITEHQSPNATFSLATERILYEGESAFQKIVVADTKQFGRTLVLDGVFQTSVAEEWVYHEMIAHIPLLTHPNPQKVLVIGGGDGGCVREVLKHDSVQHIDHVEIDGEVVRLAKEYFPTIAKALIDMPDRLHLEIGDGIAKVEVAENEYDVIIVDCSDPIGPGEGLFTKTFYQNAYRALKSDGILVQQTESPYYHASLVHDCVTAIHDVFPVTRLYLAAIPLYPGGLHSFTMGSKQYDPLLIHPERKVPKGLKYYHHRIYQSAFVLPNFVKKIIGIDVV